MNIINIPDTQALQASAPAAPVESAMRAKTSEQATKEPTQGELKQMVDKANESLKINNSDLQFVMDQDTEQMVVKVVDRETKEVLRQFPSVEMIELSKSIEKMQGVLVSKTA